MICGSVDITYAINACTHYLDNPNSMHYQAVKCIACYLYLTCNKGLMLTLTNKNHLCAYIDRNFASSWSKHTSHLHQSALSHASFVITYSGCPIHWVSKLESKIALSTCEAEYIALSMCAHMLILLCCILDELTKWFFEPHGVPAFANAQCNTSTHQLQSVIHKDNQASNLPLTPCPLLDLAPVIF